MGSPLDFANTDGFRKVLLGKNLKPYPKSPVKVDLPVDYEYRQRYLPVLDSPDELIDKPSFANNLYPLNQYGKEGGYQQVPDPGALLNRKSNEGEYGFQDAKVLRQAEPKSLEWKSINKFGDGSELVQDGAPFLDSINTPYEEGSLPNVNNNQPYPTTFVPSTYSPVSILLNPNPTGSNGTLSQDSFIARLGARKLREEFQERIAAQIVQDTVGRANIFNVDSATDLQYLLSGRVPLIEPNWVITIPENPVLAATNFALRLAGSIFPVSPIPGSYFDDGISLRQPTTSDQLQNAYRDSVVGNVMNTLLGTNMTGSEIFYNNTGSGQKAQLFKNLDFNRYKPSFERTLFNRLGGLLVGSTTDNSNFYVGSNTTNPSRVTSPSKEIPIDSYGREVQAPVYGLDELAQIYEGVSREIKLGANGPTYSDGGGIEGGFTWVSPKYKGNAGKKVGVGGLITVDDEDFKPSSYNSTESTNLQLKSGSILDDTQRLIDSQPEGGRRLKHVGNAIDQVSKVFNDGYKELTKGSRVLTYVGDIGQEVGTEYCRVFAKDIPYLQYNDLQKTDGTVTEGRRFSYSVFDKTYNLNIVPNKQEGGQSSSNLINGPGGLSTNVAYAKKYMFSLENLAWRTSSTPGYTTSDLPICERGPNGGRVMWFPPYNLKFSETVSPSWKTTSFLGRPEPVYTYENTSRGGSISWDIVVDHPSVLNVITNKVLGNETDKTRVNSILESFFAGCRKYDLYELAKKYYTINPNDLYQIQTAINSKEVTVEQMQYIKKELESGSESPNGADQNTAPALIDNPFKSYNNRAFYFGNDYPKAQGTNYQSEFDRYTGTANRDYYTKQKNSQETSVFFDSVVTPNFASITGLTQEMIKSLEQNDGTITIQLKSSCSAPASEEYNISLAGRRLSSVTTYFESTGLQKYIKEGRVIFDTKNAIEGENARVEPLVAPGFTSSKTIFCSKKAKDAAGNTVDGDTVGNKEITTANAMACRAVRISNIDAKLTPKVNKQEPPKKRDVLVGNVITETKKIDVPEERIVFRDNITKRVLRMLLTECDYFEVIKQETPMVFDNLKDKLKFFQPAFHSTTPEGLNSRLTFLQQCMRPGDTIPTIKDVDGSQTLQYNNATNTSFGTPPVLILRVGDFYHTKIIPDSLQLQYESLDINPEGIGVQPMIAKVTLQFKFVGGQGLKNSIDKLQNALTFNYYANSEMWDDRADVTDDSYKVYDKQFLSDLNIQEPPAANQATNPAGQSNNSTIGVITSSKLDEFETGTIQYSDFMVKVKDETQTYFQNVVSKQKEVLKQYNNAVRQQWQAERNYTKGFFVLSDSITGTTIFGKPENIQQRFDSVYNQMEKDIENGTDKFISYISETNLNMSIKAIRQIKSNYAGFVKNKKGTYQNALTTISQTVVNLQQNYVQTIGRINSLTYLPASLDGRGTDGYQQPNGNVVIYNISGTTDVDKSSGSVNNTMDELLNDVRKIRDSLSEFNFITSSQIPFSYAGKDYSSRLIPQLGDSGKEKNFDVSNVFTPLSLNTQFSDLTFRRQYMFLSDDVVDEKKYQVFKNQIIGKIIGNAAILGNQNYDIERVFDNYWLINTKPLFVEENELTNVFIDKLEKDELKTYLNYTPFEKKPRNFTFTNEPQPDDVLKTQKDIINGLGASVNPTSDNKTWNDKIPNATFDAYNSKIKFN